MIVKYEENKIIVSREKAIDVQGMVITAMFIALTYVATAFINIRLPIQANGGLIHLGNVPLFVCAVLFGKKKGAIAGGVGMALFDLLSGWFLWAPFTLVIVALMGFVTGLITEKKNSIGYLLIAYIFAVLIKIGGYYIAEGVIYHNWIAPVTSIPGNIVQVVTGAVIATPIIFALKKYIKKHFVMQ